MSKPVRLKILEPTSGNPPDKTDANVLRTNTKKSISPMMMSPRPSGRILKTGAKIFAT